MSYLHCNPYVSVVGSNYQIVIVTQSCGIISVIVGGKRFFPENNGVLCSGKNYAKIDIPQEILNSYKKYTVAFRKTVERKAYFSELCEEQYETFSFKPLLKEKGINIYHIADIHMQYELAEKTANFFSNDIDLFIFNGDIGEVEKVDDLICACAFIGKVSRAEIPVIVTRGNHDMRGKCAELYGEFFPTQNGKSYFGFSIGPFEGVVFDCGEDKEDSHKEYGASLTSNGDYVGTNDCYMYRQRQTEFLNNTTLSSEKIKMAIGHICPIQKTLHNGDIFDIDRDVYEKWNNALQNMDIDFMLCGHVHFAYILDANEDKSAFFSHNYPVIVGSALTFDEKRDETIKNSNIECLGDKVIGTSENTGNNSLIGTALTFNGTSVTVRFTDENHNILLEKKLSLR